MFKESADHVIRGSKLEEDGWFQLHFHEFDTDLQEMGVTMSLGSYEH